jgi:hypothetical protein
MSLQQAILGAAVLVATVGLATPASAQTCTSDKDCPQSYSCVTSGVVTEPVPACPPNADCAKLVDAGQIVVMTCEPKACTADADCGAGMICHTDTEQSCSGGGAAAPCPANTRCDGGVITEIMSTCTANTRKLCAFKWQLPCSAGADCGDGFTCEPDVSVGCSGSGTATVGSAHTSTGGASYGFSGSPLDGGSAPVSVDAGTVGVAIFDGGSAPMCTTMSSFPGYCSLKVTTCATDADCPSAWKCADVSTAVGATSGAAMGGGSSAPTAASGAPALPADAGAAKACVSPLGGGYGYPLRGGVSNGDVPQANGSGGTGGTATTGGASGTPASAGDKGSGKTIPLVASNPSSSSSGGCSLAGGGAEPTALVLFALVAFGRARRRSR